MSGEILFINNKSRQLYYAKQVVQAFLACLKGNCLIGLKNLLWYDINLIDRITNQEIYGKPYVLEYFDRGFNDYRSMSIIDIKLAVLPKNKPALVIRSRSKTNYPIKELFVFTIIEHKIIEIERSNYFPKDIIIAE